MTYVGGRGSIKKNRAGRRAVADVDTVHEIPRAGLGLIGRSRRVTGMVSGRDVVRFPSKLVIRRGACCTGEIHIDRQFGKARYPHAYWVAQDLLAGGNGHRGVTAEGHRVARTGY